jgi:D-lactate dehydrogenase (cytochrome)
MLVSYASDLMAELGFSGSIVSHAGDGNMHTGIYFPPDDDARRASAHEYNDRLVKRAIELDGTSTGEHGVGLGKQKYMALEHGAGALNVMRQIKQVLDPEGVLNPGKILGASNL